ncbi:PREDICTED: protein SET DOMAIN GROUP 41 [Tarenaya hassleriana]|uniref:protein SET DOMAIN GROUP 41 n=1 Tax=Tarenaya hassleriana TaxID=28532 RepID=UPI00053C4D4D|nr:PREDICTED: protein SET DOMAIN GROUP 41 [Tarenaya hassleriana]
MESLPPETAEIEMRAAEEIEIAQDISPPLSPFAFSLYDSFLSSHCSVCFSPLPSPPPSLYCSAACSLSDSSAEFPQLPPDVSPLLSSDVFAALRLLNSLSTSAAAATSSSLPHRIGGLLTNHHRLIDDPSVSTAIRRAAAIMSTVRRSRGDFSNADDAVLEESALCAVMTNAVEVQDNSGRGLGVAVFDGRFSWINHSCSPNACYRFMISSPETASCQEDLGRPPKMVPHTMNREKENADVRSNTEPYLGSTQRYGPKLIVRSIKRIKKGEEITLSYIDLLRPKLLRQSDLWSKYRFLCSCERCAASPPAHVDSMLQGVIMSEPEETTVDLYETAHRDEAAREISDYVEETIDDFLSGDIGPKACCEEIESMLNQGIQKNDPRGARETEPWPRFWLHPLQHIALNAYITLASAYKIRSTSSVAVDSEIESPNLNPNAFDMGRISAAYSLFLAGASHYLFSLEPSLILSAANFWTNAGESLLDLALNLHWDSPVSSLPPIPELKCEKCSWIHSLESPDQHRDLDESSAEFLRCVADIARHSWSFLVRDCGYLRKFRSPLDFGFLGTTVSDGKTEEVEVEAKAEEEEKRVSILRLGVHCIAYAALLADICYGHDSHLVSNLYNVLYPP